MRQRRGQAPLATLPQVLWPPPPPWGAQQPLPDAAWAQIPGRAHECWEPVLRVLLQLLLQCGVCQTGLPMSVWLGYTVKRRGTCTY